MNREEREESQEPFTVFGVIVAAFSKMKLKRRASNLERTKKQAKKEKTDFSWVACFTFSCLKKLRHYSFLKIKVTEQ